MIKLFNYSVTMYENGVWGAITTFERPFSDTETLDESLDSGNILLKGTTRSDDIAPFTRMRITVSDGTTTETIERVTGSRKRTRKTYVPFANNTYLYDWEIQLLELTKLLERDIIRTMTFTNNAGRNYLVGNMVSNVTTNGWVDTSDAIANAWMFKKSDSSYTYDKTDISTQSPYLEYPILPNTYFTIPLINWDGQITLGITAQLSGAYYFVLPDGTESFIGYDDRSQVFGQRYPYSGRISYTGNFAIRYYAGALTGTASNQIFTSFGAYTDLPFSVVESLPVGTPLYVTDAVNRILSSGITRRLSIERQKYIFDSTQAAEYENYKMPEMSITRCTLFEALLQVGNVIHAVPRLVSNHLNGASEVLSIVFDKLGQNEVREITASLIDEEGTHPIDEYCGTIDSCVDNLVSTIDINQGAVTEPISGKYKTIRCETGKIEISANDMVIRLEHPAYQIVKLECGFIQGKEDAVGDITDYLYEDAAYEALSSYTGAVYPNSKAYALCWKQGSQTITGLNFKVQAAVGVATKMQNYAIRNIIQVVSGVDIGSAYDYTTLAFRVTYIPLISARVQQRKSKKGISANNTLCYNQGGNSVETYFYGEKMKGAIARLGNEVLTRTYDFKKLVDVPSCGEIVVVDGVNYYIAVINKRYERDFIRCTLIMTPDYNKLSEYVGINSNFRLYDISEKHTVDADIVYGEEVIIGNKINGLTALNNNPLITSAGMQNFTRVFLQSEGTSASDITAARCRLYDSNGNQLASVLRPVVSVGLGNSIAFLFDFLDNYGAEYQSNDGPSSMRVQHLVPYTDAYGQADTMSVALLSENQNATLEDQQNDGFANLYPAALNLSSLLSTVSFATYTNRFIIKKDNRERLRMCIQLHFRSNRDGIVFGTQLSQGNSLVAGVKGISHIAILKFLPYKLNAFHNGPVDISSINAINANYSVVNTGLTNTPYITFSRLLRNDAAKSWALIDGTTRELIIGCNEDIAEGEVPNDLYFNFVDNNNTGE